MHIRLRICDIFFPWSVSRLIYNLASSLPCVCVCVHVRVLERKHLHVHPCQVSWTFAALSGVR